MVDWHCFCCSILQLTWLNQHLTKIWPYVNEVDFVFVLLFWGLFLMCWSLFYFAEFCVIGSFWSDKSFGRACSWTIQAYHTVITQVFQIHPWHCGSTVHRFVQVGEERLMILQLVDLDVPCSAWFSLHWVAFNIVIHLHFNWTAKFGWVGPLSSIDAML